MSNQKLFSDHTLGKQINKINLLDQTKIDSGDW